ncbi:MAG TPA: DUF362 domain-containing protein [Thermoleophilia bacterium]
MPGTPSSDLRAGSERVPVVAARCSDYELAAVRAALRRVLAPLGGMQAFVRGGERIALKPNLLLAASPESGITTHPAVVAAVALEVLEAGAHPVVVESPGSGILYSRTVVDRVYRKTGLRAAAERHSFDLNLDMGWESVSNPQARLARRLDVVSPVLRADGVINLAKFKTHNFMTFTGAVKNMFGVVPGVSKVGYHGKLADPKRFADMLLDIVGLVAPRLNIVDGITALEGSGPGTAGKARQLGVLLASADPVALDAACCRIACIDTHAVPVLVAARDRGLWTGHAKDVETVGIPLAELQVNDFELPGRLTRAVGVSSVATVERLLRPVLRSAFSPLPHPKKGRCTKCGACEQACPAGAIRMDEQVAAVDRSRCIRCYCCHEVCPVAAIDLEFSGMGRVVHRVGLV